MGMPMYMRIQQYIRDRIESGEWEKDTAIPTEFELMDQFGVSRITVTTALRQLVNEGIIYRVQGKGTFVSGRTSSVTLFDIADLLQAGGPLDTANVSGEEHKCLSIKLCYPDKSIAETLGLKKAQKIYEVIRTKGCGKCGGVVERLYLPAFVYMGYPEERMRTEHISDIIKYCGIVVGKRIVSMEAVICEAELCSYIGVSAGAPVLKVSFEIYDNKEQPIALIEMFGAGQQRKVILN